MTQRQKALLSCAVAAALLLSGCRKGNSDSGSMSSSNAMSGSSGSASTTQTGGWKTGLGILTEASDEARTGTIHTIAAAVLLDGDGKLADVMLDELEVEVTADGKGVVTMPTDYRTKRQKGDDYPLAAASSLKKGWAEQADDFADYLTGMTPEQASMLETDKDGKAADADLLSGCTIRVDQYRDAVAKACTNASALGAAKGDRVSLGVEAENASSDITATDDKDVNAQVDVSIVALTTDADRRVTSAIADMAEPALTVVSDGGVTAPDLVKTKLELGEDDHVWKLLADSKTCSSASKISSLQLVQLFSALLSADPTYTGTPSALSAKIDPDGRLGITPKKVTRLVLESLETLRENGILVKTYRSNGKRLISLRSAESADLSTVGKIDPIDPVSRQNACTAP